MSVSWRKNSVFASIIGLVAVGWLILALLNPGGPGGLGTVLAGLILGTMFGQVSLAAAWCALGPFPLIQRLPLSFTWIAAVVVAFGCNIARTPNPQGFSVWLVYAGAMLLQWLFLQLPMWIAVVRYGLRVGLENDGGWSNDYRDKQFGIRQIMILTVLVALVLGASRLMLGGLKADASFKKSTEILIFAFLAFANAAVSLPLVSTVLLRQKAFAATCGALLLSAFATAIELSALTLFLAVGMPDEYWMFSLINGFQVAWILAVLLLLRTGGFRLLLRGTAIASDSD
jgi:hypothetical protein